MNETEQITARDFQQVSDWVRGKYGAAEKLRQAFEKAIGRPFGRGTMDRWIHPDPAQRVQPVYESGKLFLIVAGIVMAAWRDQEAERLNADIRKRVSKRPVGRPRKVVA